MIDLLYQFPQAATQLFFVYLPVTQTTVIIFTFSKPAIVHNHHIDSERGSFFGQFVYFFSIQIKVHGLPAIEQHRPDLVAVCASAYMLPDTAMVLSGQFPIPFIRIAQHRLRHHQLFPLLQRIVEQIALQSHHNPCLTELILFRLAHKVAAVHKHHAIAASHIFRSPLPGNDHSRIVLMAGCPPAAADDAVAPCDLPALEIPFHGMPSTETDQVITVRQKIQTGRGSLFHNDLFRSAIDDFCTPCYDILFFQYTVQKTHPHCAHCIFQDDFQRLCFFPVRIHGGKPLQAVLSPHYLIVGIVQAAAVGAVAVFDIQPIAPIVPGPEGGIFLRKRIQRVRPVASQHIRVA